MSVRLQGRVFSLLPLAVAALLLMPHVTLAADLSLTPSTGSVATGGTVSLRVIVDPGSDSVNAADGTISFDSSLLSVSSISKDGSAFSLWTADPSYSNTDGTISFSGGTPTALTAKGTVMTIVFKGKALGTATVSFSKASVLAADGKGTDVYKNGNSATLTVTSAAAAQPAPSDTTSSDSQSAADGATPLAPIITSSTHPKPDNWYSTSTVVFNWILPSDVMAVRSLLSNAPSSTPKVTLKGGATSTQTISGIADGVSYYALQFKNDFGWSDTGYFKVQIDTVPPTDFSIALMQPGSDGGPPKFTFKTDDLLSGLDHYEIIVGTSTPIAVSAKDITDGSYPVPPQAGGQTHVVIKAFDKAGNVKEATADLVLPAVAKPKPAAAADTTTQTSTGSGYEGYVAILMALLAGGFFSWNLYYRRVVQREKEKLLQAVLEVRDKNDRIFSAMREEFEQLINDFDEKPQLTPQERELLESIKEVLDISEELVDSSIEDLKKMVRNQ